MQFKNKLDFLMNITQTSNKELAKGIAVDPSLISLLRSGKRKQPKNILHIKNMSTFFALRCTANFQREALSEMLCEPSIRNQIPAEVLAERLQRWLQGDVEIVEEIMEGIESDSNIDLPNEEDVSIPDYSNDTMFFYGEEGRRQATRYASTLIKNIEKPCPIYIAIDDTLEWLLSDYIFSKELQKNIMEMIQRGFTIYQIMPAMNFINRYTESLRFWLPLYSTGKMKVFYYPRIRDNLFRHSAIIVPEHYVETTTTIGAAGVNHITLVSKDKKLINEYTNQFNEYLSLCRPALQVYLDYQIFSNHFSETLTLSGNITQMVSTLSANTLPSELLEKYIEETSSPYWKKLFENIKNDIPAFEENLNTHTFIDISPLATVEEIQNGNVYITTNYDSSPTRIVYTPETYVMHLKNIVRLLDQFPNFHFIPNTEKPLPDYNLIVNENGPAILTRTNGPILMLEMRRPELVICSQEYLVRKAEKAGYTGIQRTRIRLELINLIEELQKS